jgi:hypothetical protein
LVFRDPVGVAAPGPVVLVEEDLRDEALGNPFA